MSDTVVTLVLAIAACILLSGLFSGAETALTSLHHARLEQLIKRKRPGTGLLLAWRDHPSTVLSFLLIANNLVNILASSLATQLSLTVLAAAGIQGATSFAIAIAVGMMLFLILVFGEVLPKTFARHNPKTVMTFLSLLRLLYLLFYPFARLLGHMSHGFISLTGGNPASPPPTITEEELEYLIREGTKEGAIDRHQERLLSGALALEDRVAREVMVPRTEAVMFEAKDSLDKVMTEIERHKFSRYPVFQEARDNVIGFFYVKDLLTYFRQPEAERKPFKLRDFVRPPYYVPESKPLDSLLSEFQKERIHIAIVVDEYGGTAGLVTLEDVIEELVGEIYDEHDQEPAMFQQLNENTWIVNARVPVEEISQVLSIPVKFPNDRDYDTVGGLIMELAESVPKKGEVFTYVYEAREGENPDQEPLPSLRFTVLDSNGVRLGRIKLEVMGLNQEEA